MRRQFEDHIREETAFHRLLGEVFTGNEKIEETEHGYTLLYPAEETWRRKLEQLGADLSRRCPAVEVEVAVDDASDRLRLHVGGSATSKQFVAGLIVAAQTGGLELPSPLRSKMIHRYRRLTSGMRALPSFLIIGEPRCGTTSLYGYLTEHPRVLPAATKEVGFFDIYYGRGPAAYRANFPLKLQRSEPAAPRGGFVTGEATPTYLLNPRVPQRVREMLPDVKLIAMLRNPVERAFSHYHFSVRNGLEPLGFEEAIEAEPERLEGELEKLESDDRYWSAARVYHSYLTTGVYVDQLEAWTEVFPREQIHVICMEEFAADSPGEFRRVLEFLDLPEFEPAEFKTMNAFPYPDLAQATRERLAEYFRPHNERLWTYLGTDYGWNRAPAAVT